MIKFICYPKCTTCQRAKKWLDDNKIKLEFKLDNDNNPFKSLSPNVSANDYFDMSKNSVMLTNADTSINTKPATNSMNEFVDNDDVLHKDALYYMVEELNRFPLLRRSGAFSVNKKSPQASMEALKFSQHIHYPDSYRLK